jgi:hypothetical protein
MRRVLALTVLVAACANPKPAVQPAHNTPGPDDDADQLIAVILAPEPPAEDFQSLANLWPKLTPAKQAAIIALGTDPKTPIHVPSIDFEYAWAQAFDCQGGQYTNMQQALIDGPSGQLDLLSFDCADATHHEIYYDFSADPTEKAFRDSTNP